MRPTLEEVKEYFKDAKTVEDKSKHKANFNHLDDRGIHEWLGDFYVYDLKNMNCLLWSSSQGYAKILTYKEKDMKITKEQVLAIHDCGIESVQILLQSFFPKYFKERAKLFSEPLLSLNDLLSVWGLDNDTDIGFYKESPMFKKFERLAEDKIKSK